MAIPNEKVVSNEGSQTSFAENRISRAIAMPAKIPAKASGAAIIPLSRSEPEWSPEDDDDLRELVDANAPINVICSLLKREANAVRWRVLALRLTVRSPR